MTVERFAPSPTGPLHLGHAFSAHEAWRHARDSDGRFLLRLEDLDASRARPAYAEAIEEDLRWLGLDWDGPVLCQSTQAEAYEAALLMLSARGLTYACTCTRRDIQQALSAPQEGAAIGPDGLIYPGICRRAGHAPKPGRALRLDMGAAIAALGGPSSIAALSFEELGLGPEGQRGLQSLEAAHLIDGVGDVVLARRDGAVAYHLAVVVDDAYQGVTHVTRGQDLFSATPIHRVLQALLELPVPLYRHHALVRDPAGKRLAKRDDARAIALYRAEGLSPEDVLQMARQATGLAG